MTAPDQQPHPEDLSDFNDLNAIEDYIYSSMNHTKEWEKAEQAYQNILSRRASHHLARQNDPATDRHQQCLNCCFVNSRRCTYHGYPDDKIPVYCMYKIGTAAFEAQENLQGTFIEWQHLKEHDAAIAAVARAEGAREERERIYRILYDFNDSFKSSIHVDELGQLIESLRSQQPGGEDGGCREVSDHFHLYPQEP